MGFKSRFSFVSVVALVCGVFAITAFAAKAPNPRESNQKAVGRVGAPTVNTARRVSGNVRSGITAPGVVSTRVSRAGRIPSSTNTRNGAMTRVFSRSATTVSRAANPVKSVARSGKKTVAGGTGYARSALSRATAIFNDVSKIGSGYAACRESYATCMDQMCAAANDTYRRCFCSERFIKFRDTEQALDQAMVMLRQFEDNNLNAVDKTAAEVSAMYSATVGEQAIKNDTSAAAQVLNSIGDLLSGKIPANSKTLNDLGGIDFSSDLGDIWGNNASSSIFGSNEKDLSELEGAALFSSAQQQCVRLTQSQCENDAVFNMAKSSYNILISQDCNLYEKTLNKKRENVEDAVRQAEKILRDARLEEYRSHNSADVNECIDRVRTAMLQDTACGADYKRCLDPTGAYVSATTGEPIYSQRFLKLGDLTNLSGDMGGDILNQNQTYNTYLDGYRQRAASALDTCRDNAEYVWTEFKRAAIIEIAQAQAALVEEVKANCVSTIAECYDSQTGQLNSFDTTESKAAGAIGRYAAAGMCKDRVNMCAALYGDGKCNFDSKGRLSNKDVNNTSCGLTALLSFVSAVDSVKVAELCETALNNYLKEICTPSSGDEGYPWNCRTESETSLRNKLNDIADTNCKDPDTKTLNSNVDTKIETVLGDVSEEVSYALSEKCAEINGYWLEGNYDEGSKFKSGSYNELKTGEKLLPGFYSNVFGRGSNDQHSRHWGVCVENTVRTQCLAFNTDTKTVATYNAGRDDCEFTDDWYNERCELIGGYYEGGTCYKPK